ncbi:MAG: hypothetical protein ACI8ZM_004656 [Crocinitomix sp.]|jgi:hypothetical protein
MTGYLIGAGVLGILGLILWLVKNKKAGKSASLELMDTSRIKDVNQNYTEMEASMGAGSFSLQVEVKGKAHSETPIESELSKEPVVYFKSEVVHEYEKQETRKTKDGTEKHWVKHKDTVSENLRWAAGFGVVDETGFIEVNANKSKFHTEKLYSNFEKGDPNKDSSGGLNLKIKGFSIGIGGGSKNKGLRTIGYRYTETGIRMGTQLYVVGDANDRDGGLIISDPKDKADQFIVSVKSKQEFIGNIGSAVKGLTIGAFVSWAAAAACIVMGIVN